ncbi:fungal-specific transcription factor domain-containing protein [Lentinula lateritia]|uniref:Fungal-specific transcription factor domain-containing protein n=1 Tax=Lentinula lateritia TaxID=40482 RepID=A0ABQ8VYQ5_9AGAR|nr:fungal-specific transcription factor domain-containing protein [Lentinula lateritia]
MSDSEDSNRPSATVKRKRALRACDQCFKRKVKCDCDEMPNSICSVCLSLGIDCTHLIQRKKRGPKSKFYPKGSDAKTLITTILSAQKTVIIPKDESIVREMLVEIASYARELERQLEQFSEQRIQRSSASPPISKPSPLYDSQDEDEAHELLILQTQTLRLDNALYNKHLGRSSHFMLLKTALNIRDEAGAGSNEVIEVETEKSKSWSRAFWHRFPPEPVDPPYEFPEPDLLRKLLDLYFDKHHPIYPVLHRPSFERYVYIDNLHLTNRRFGAVVLVACALGSRLSDDPRTLYDGTQDIRSAGWKYYGQIRLISTSLSEPLTLYDVQLYALSLVFLFPTPAHDAAWLLLALGIRSAQDHGVYRKTNFKKRMSSRFEEEQWRRAFWNLAATDLYMSIATGRPRSTREDDFDLELPPDCDDEYWEIPSHPHLEYIQPIGKPSLMSYWHYFVKLLHIAGLVKDHLFTTRKSALWENSPPDGNDKIVMELDSALNSWMDELPDHLKWDPHRSDDLLFSQSVSLHSNYYWVQIQLHKVFIRPGPLNTGNFPSLAICTNAARSYIHILQACFARPGMPLLPHYIAPTFIAAVILLINLWTSLRDKTRYDPRKDMADVYSCVDHLRAYEKRYEQAGRLHDVLEAVMSVSKMPPPSQKESLKRSRDPQPAQTNLSMPDNSVRQFAGTRRVSYALDAASASQADGLATGYVGAFQGSSVLPLSPGSMFDPFFGVNIATSEQPTVGFNFQPQLLPAYPSSLSFNPTAASADAASFDLGMDGSGFTTSFSSDWSNSSPEDWTSFMSKVDDLLHDVNPDGL